MRTTVAIALVACAACVVGDDAAIETEQSALDRGDPPPPGPQVPGRAAIWNLVPDTPIDFRFWLNHGGATELRELTGPNDRQLVGDFRGVGHDQVMFLNYYGGTRRVVIADFWTSTSVPSLVYVEPWQGSRLLKPMSTAEGHREIPT